MTDPETEIHYPRDDSSNHSIGTDDAIRSHKKSQGAVAVFASSGPSKGVHCSETTETESTLIVDELPSDHDHVIGNSADATSLSPCESVGAQTVPKTLGARLDFDFLALPDMNSGEDDSISMAVDLDGTNSDIQAAIEEIRKEASQVDVILAMDQVKTLQTELEVVCKQFEARSLEAEDLRIQLEEAEERFSHLELERDLHQADAQKLREDLKTCVERMFDISLVAGQSTLGSETGTVADEHGDPANERKAGLKSTHVSKHMAEICSPKSKMLTEAVPRMQIVGLVEEPQRLIRRLPTMSDPGLQFLHSVGYRMESSDDSVRPLLAGQMSQPLRDQNIFRKRNHRRIQRPRLDSIRPHRKDPPIGHQDSYGTGVPHRRRSSSMDRARGVGSRAHRLLEDEGGEKKMCGIFRRRTRRQPSMEREGDVSLMKDQIKQLHGMMRTSLATSEKLRKRLALISQYYEGVVKKLQERVVDIEMEKTRIEVDLHDVVSRAHLKKRLDASQLQAEIRRRDTKIKALEDAMETGEV